MDGSTIEEKIISLIELEIEQLKFEKAKQKLELCEQDPDFYITEAYKNILNRLDLRREEVLLKVTDQISNYYDGLRKTILTEIAKTRTDLSRTDFRIKESIGRASVYSELDLEREVKNEDSKNRIFNF